MSTTTRTKTKKILVVNNKDNIDELPICQNPIDTLPWIEKYRPSKLDDILSHHEIISTVKICIKNKCLPHLLFYGPPGTGKTSLITAAAKELYGKYFPFMVMELNASDDRGIEVVRSKIKQFVMSKNVFYGKTIEERNDIFKLVILDETDAMTNDAQAILRKVVEEYTINTRFCLICNYIQNISPALQSRCTRFRFSPIKVKDIKFKIKEISEKENLNITKEGINTVVNRSNGDMRKVLNILQSVSMAYPKLNEKYINNCLGYPRSKVIKQMLECLINSNFKETYDKFIELKTRDGLALNDVITEVYKVLVAHISNSYQNTQITKIIKDITDNEIINILDRIRQIEINNSANTLENIQISGFISAFKSCLST
jgi:replication factor C subunit 3/5